MKRLEFNTVIHNGVIDALKNNSEIKNKEVKVIIMWEEKPLAKKRRINVKSEASKELEKINNILDKGADISSFGDIREWQRLTRAERKVNYRKL